MRPRVVARAEVVADALAQRRPCLDFLGAADRIFFFHGSFQIDRQPLGASAEGGGVAVGGPGGLPQGEMQTFAKQRSE